MEVIQISNSPLHIEVRQSADEWLHYQLQADIGQATVRGPWKEKEDTQGITWGYFRSITDAQLYAQQIGPWRME